ncbi:MAG TPA: flavin reductase family protein [Anaerolineae bacterium]|nr:flavin reductase family protein [Anaerolineae bacterium]
MTKQQIPPNTTLYPVPVVLITCGPTTNPNIFTLNRIASCNAEPPMLAISVRPARASHDLITQTGQFVVNIPTPDMEIITDFIGITTARFTDKWTETGLIPRPATHLDTPLIDQCPVNIECQVEQTLSLPSHTLFIAQVLTIHADPAYLNQHQEVDFNRAQGGLPYRSTIVRERPVTPIKTAALRPDVHAWRDQQPTPNN